MSRLETWDKVENAISAAEHMVELLILANEHDGPVDFAINEIEARVAVVKDLFYKLHGEVHQGRHERPRLTLAPADAISGKPDRAKDPARSERAREGWKKRRRRSLTGRSHKLKADGGSNVVPLR
jgi:hypothetical protein